VLQSHLFREIVLNNEHAHWLALAVHPLLRTIGSGWEDWKDSQINWKNRNSCNFTGSYSRFPFCSSSQFAIFDNILFFSCQPEVLLKCLVAPILPPPPHSTCIGSRLFVFHFHVSSPGHVSDSRHFVFSNLNNSPDQMTASRHFVSRCLSVRQPILSNPRSSSSVVHNPGLQWPQHLDLLQWRRWW
jgi:hypothetical protein